MHVAPCCLDITRIARERFFLDELMERFLTEETGRLRIVTADARSRVKGCAGGKAASPRYDAVINDSFSGGEPTEGLMGEEGLRAIKAARAFSNRLPAIPAVLL